MEIKAESYQVDCDIDQRTVKFCGSLLLNGVEEYKPIAQLLTEILEQGSGIMTLDIRELKMLNSSGFQMLSKFVMKARQHENLRILFQGNSKFPWQTKSLRNLQRLMPSIDIEFE